MRERILRFFREKKKIDSVGYDTDLFESGVVNSLFALEIVLFLEREFHIRLSRRQINEENFRTIGKMAELVEKMGGVYDGKDD